MRFGRMTLVAWMSLLPGVLVAQAKRNVILFVADGLRRGSVDAATMPTFYKVRTTGVDFQNSHSVYPTFTTANASAIATGHGLGDTGDYANALYPGVWLTKPETKDGTGYLVPFLENDEVLANMNGAFGGNYLGERTLLSVAREHGFNVASVGKIGPTAIQQMERVSWTPGGRLSAGDAVILDDSTGAPEGLPVPAELQGAMLAANLATEAPSRSNGYGTGSQWNNANQGDAQKPGTLEANLVQESWFADVTTRVLLPRFAASGKPFLLLFWSRDPDGSQHNEGDSLQTLTPGINGETSKRGLRNADRCLKQLLDWLDAHPAIKANTDVLLTSDHGFATISRREIASDGSRTEAASGGLTYTLNGKEVAEPKGTLPEGFLAVDLAIQGKLRMFDAGVRATAGPSVFKELPTEGDHPQYPEYGSALLGDAITHVDGSDARLIVAANGGSDLIYVPGGSAQVVHETLAQIMRLDYVGAVFVDDRFCPKAEDCPGALPMSAVGLEGASKLPRPAIVIALKHFYGREDDLQSGVQIADTGLQEGQGNHGGFGRDQTFNNMAAIGPDFRKGFADEAPMGNIDIVPTLARILGLSMPAAGSLRGRVVGEALAGGTAPRAEAHRVLRSPAAANGMSSLLEYQVKDGVTYLDSACLIAKDAPARCR